MIDGEGRVIDYVRIAITDRCNLRCKYCMPADGLPLLAHDDLLTYEEIQRTVGALATLGVRYIKLTGGEPMARKGCLELVRMLKDIPGIEQVTMTTNGVLLNGRMQAVAQAGLDGLNISLDTLDAWRYAQLTRRDQLSQVLAVIEQAVAVGIPKVKVNVVPMQGFTEESLVDLAALAKDAPLDVRFIELMPLGYGVGFAPIPQEVIMGALARAYGPLTQDHTRHGNGPARYYRLGGFTGSIGFISAVSHAFCASCNRVRITPEGDLKLCLNHAQGLPLRPLLRGGIGQAELADILQKAIAAKPRLHGFGEDMVDREQKNMSQIGG